jgi:hypothetical protein
MSKKLFLALAISLFLSGSAQAASLVDTGQPSNTTGGMSLFYPQTLFAQFVLTKPATITEIQAWINVIQAGSMWFQLYRDNGGVPGDYANSQMVAVSGTGAAWVSAASLNWPLEAGTYWVGFMGTMMGYPNNFNGTMPGPAPAPLGKEGYREFPGTPFISKDDMDIGVRISGNYVSRPSVGSGLLLLDN